MENRILHWVAFNEEADIVQFATRELAEAAGYPDPIPVVHLEVISL